MTIQEVVDMAQKGVLRSVASGGNSEDKIEMVLSYLNLSLIELYKRFKVETSEVIITLGLDGDEFNQYTMISETMYKMPADFMSLSAVYEEVNPEDMNSPETGFIPINSKSRFNSVFTVGYNKLQIPRPDLGTRFSCMYVINPTMVTYEMFEDPLAELEIPMFLLEPLLLHVAFQAHSTIKGNSDEENQAHLQRFEASCKRVDTLGLTPVEDMDSLPISYKGFI